MNRIAATFSKLKSANQKVLIPFITAGDPKPEVTVPLIPTTTFAGQVIFGFSVSFTVTVKAQYTGPLLAASL